MSRKHQASGPGKTPSGIAGFDQLTGGGLAAKRTTLVLGGPGTGKTVFALQTLVHGARRGEPGIFVSFGERPRHLVENAASFGWNLPELEEERLVFLDARVRPGGINEGRYDFSGMLAGLAAVAREIDARRVVFDSFEVQLALINDPRSELQNALRLRDWLFENEFTCVLTAHLQGGDVAAAQRFALMQVLADCTVALEHRVSEASASRSLRVLKYRGSSFIEREFPFVIGSSGIGVIVPRRRETVTGSGTSAVLGREIEVARKELTARIQALDRFLEMKQAELDFLLEKESNLPRLPEHGSAPMSAERGDLPDIKK